MPTYQYACTDSDCGNQFELVQSFTDPAVSTCPVCAQPVRKVFGSVGVVFKGSGFYRTDSRAAASGSDAKADVKPAAEKKPKPAATGSGMPTKAAAAS
jgi:putative FmdB family regulatory protein